MATLFELPPSDVLFKHIFVNLESIDVWRLRLTCRKLYELCWDYFSGTCQSLRICLSTKGQLDSSYLDIGAGINIMHVSKHLQSLEITGPCCQLGEKGFVKLLVLLVESNMVLKKLKIKNVDLTCIAALLDSVSKTCSELLELELCKISIKGRSVQQVLCRVLQHNKYNLQKLTLPSLTFSLNEPLPTNSLTALRHLSVSFFNV